MPVQPRVCHYLALGWSWLSPLRDGAQGTTYRASDASGRIVSGRSPGSVVWKTRHLHHVKEFTYVE
jgi:hypothetical protein